MEDLGAVLQTVVVSSCTTEFCGGTWVQASSVYVVNVTLVPLAAVVVVGLAVVVVGAKVGAKVVAP